MTSVQWEKYSAVERCDRAGEWLEMQANLGLAPNTIDAYGRALNDYLRFTAAAGIAVTAAGRSAMRRSR